MTGKKIVSNKELRSFIEGKLLDDQSPEEVSKRIKRHEKHLPKVSAKAIREYIASPYGRRIEVRREKVFKKKRRKHGIRKKIQGKRMISKRPKKINLRRGLGHGEMDFIVSGRSGKGILLVVVDRKTRKGTPTPLFVRHQFTSVFSFASFSLSYASHLESMNQVYPCNGY